MNKSEYSELIEKYRNILNEMIKEKKPFEEIYKISVKLDELINSYYGINSAKIDKKI